ncbi:MAG: DUF983 domain-containing protein [Pseudobacter sp.]|uniref:DUF983 domain-containing protein n=1 Tax=Pseudobacter sp. TaxID=2045420 RepID=UPI003F7D23A7
MSNQSSRPNYLWSIFSMKCPRCRRGPMFNNSNPWNLKRMFDMPEKCPVCSQRYELEPGFFYGTAYVSYALTVAISVATFVAWYVLIGMSTQDSRFFWWMGINIFLLIFLQPWLMRLSRVIYLSFFVKYDPNFMERVEEE